MGQEGSLVPRVRVSKETLTKINQLQGYLQMASGERINQDETLAFAAEHIPKIVQAEDSKGNIRTWVLDLRRRKRK